MRFMYHTNQRAAASPRAVRFRAGSRSQEPIDGATRSIEKPSWRMSRRAARVMLEARFGAALAAAGRWPREIGP